MALTYDTLNTFMKHFPEVIRNNVVEQVPLVKWALKNKLGHLGEDHIEVGIRYAVGSIKPYNATTDTYTPDETETHTKAIYDWAFYYRSEKITKKNWLAAARGGKHAVANLAEDKGNAMKDSVTLGLDGEFFATYDGTTHTFNGLPDIVSDADPTHQSSGLGNLLVADALWWKAIVLAYDSGNGDLRHHMQVVKRKVSTLLGVPDLIITTGDIFDKYYDEIASKQGFLGAKIPDYGFKSVIPFTGIPVTWSESCPEGTMYFLNSRAMGLRFHPDDFIKISPWQETSTTDPTLISTITLTAQMVVSARKALGKITGIT